MTRKRYIKLMMSKGYSRNSAREEASFVVNYNQSIAKDNKAFKARNVDHRAKCFSYDKCYIPDIPPCLYGRV